MSWDLERETELTVWEKAVIALRLGAERVGKNAVVIWAWTVWTVLTLVYWLRVGSIALLRVLVRRTVTAGHGVRRFLGRIGAGLSYLANRYFPSREFMLRVDGRVSHLVLSQHLQMGLFVLLMSGLGWVAYSSGQVVLHEQELAEKDAEIANIRVAYRSLLGEVSDYQKRYNSITQDLEENYSLVMGLIGKDSQLQKNLTSMKEGLNLNGNGRKQVAKARKTLTDQLVDVEGRMKQLASRNFSLIKGHLDTVESDLQTALTERNKALFESTRMRQDIKDLENRLVSLEEDENQAVQRLSDQTVAFVGSMENIVAMTGLKVATLIASEDKRAAQLNQSEGQGGPFIAVDPDGRPGGRLKANLDLLDRNLAHSDKLRKAISRIPFAPPMMSYRITSKYGKRLDPVNKKWGMHYGVDMSHIYKAPVYAPAPGKVTFVGWKGNFGKLVEINHGNGLVTRYAHLSKALVKKGQAVEFGDKLALVGSTGRSTGPHLHYEVLYNNKGMDPMKFMKAGRYVFQEQ